MPFDGLSLILNRRSEVGPDVAKEATGIAHGMIVDDESEEDEEDLDDDDN